jgi:hypothetical protein
VEIVLAMAAGGRPLSRTLLADTGAGARSAPFQLLLDEDDCLLCGGNPLQPITLGGAYAGAYPTYGLSVRLPALGFDKVVHVVGVATVPVGFDGIACFGILNRFTYGNVGDPIQFGLECRGQRLE